MKYEFEKDLERNKLAASAVNARRFARAIRDALDGLDLEARCYCLYEEDYYLDTKAFLEKMATRLEAKSYTSEQDKPRAHACPVCRGSAEPTETQDAE